MDSTTIIVGSACLMIGGFLGVVVVSLLKAAATSDENPYGRWLDRTCWVLARDCTNDWIKCRIVAVSHRGAVAVRQVDGMDDKARWILKYLVSRRMTFFDPYEEDVC